MNPYLENVLLAYYQRRRRRHLVVLAVCAAGALAVTAWLLLSNPEEGWMSKPVGLVGIPCAFGVITAGVLSTIGDRRRILRWLREGHAIRAVKRDVMVFRHKRIEKRVPTIFVELSNGCTSKIMSSGDLKELARIEELLRNQMASEPSPCAELPVAHVHASP